MQRIPAGWARRVLGALLATGLVGAAALVTTPAARAQETAACATSFPAYQPAARAATAQPMTDLAIPMSDGVVLRADVQLPQGVPGPHPVALTITGYGKSGLALAGGAGGAAALANPATGLLAHGYATVMVDDRGTGASGGTWDSWGPRTVADYREVLDWIVAQPWSDGRVGVTGASYMGITSLYAAASQHPAVKAVFATVPMGDAYRDIVLAGGQVNTAFVPLWMGLVTGLGIVSAGSAETIVDHLIGIGQFQLPTLAETALGGATAYDGPFWRQRSPIEVADRIQVPTFLIGGLDDLFQRGTPMLYEALADHVDTRLLIGPWTHASTGAGLPRDGVPSPGQLLVQWFDEHVRGLDAGAACIPAVTQFVRGHDRYESTTSWPAPGLSARRWYLQGDGGLAPSAPPAGGASRSYVELPITGLCSRSTAQWLIGVLDATPCATDNRLDESIGSLTYTSEPLAEEVLINGPIQADVWVTTTTGAATVSVAVSDVAPDGTSRGLSNGLLTARHRAVDPGRSRSLDGQSIQPWHPFTAEAALPVVPGEPMLLPIEVFPTSAALAPGHRLRVTIAPFDVPHALPPLPDALDLAGGTVQVLSDADHPSSIVLPVAAATADPARAAVAAAAGAAADGGGAARRVDPGRGDGAASPADDGAVRPSLPRTGGDADVLPALFVLGAVILLRRARPS